MIIILVSNFIILNNSVAIIDTINGKATHHQDQSILLVSFSTKKIKNSTVVTDILYGSIFIIYILIVRAYEWNRTTQ